MKGFSGSYDSRDVTFLLKPIDLAPIDVDAKERWIQSGGHYSEVIGREERPSEAYKQAFSMAFERNRARYAADLLALAALIHAARPGIAADREIVLVSLARAGTPIGVSLSRILKRDYSRRVAHYSISIIRDRGIDVNALLYILSRHRAENITFVDGWTAKGVIQEELERSLAGFEKEHRLRLAPELFVVADLSGRASYAATAEDYVLPSAILNATISGLISRSIWNTQHVGPDDFHGCLLLTELAADDLSRWFVDQIDVDVQRIIASKTPTPPAGTPAPGLSRSRDFVKYVQTAYRVTDPNHIKPGISEATRVLLRRVPDLLLLRDVTDPDVHHLRVLARDRAVEIREEPSMPFKAAALIRQVS